MELRNIAAKTLSALAESRDGIEAVQWFCTDEASLPFQWYDDELSRLALLSKTRWSRVTDVADATCLTDR